MALVVEQDETLDLPQIRLLGSDAVTLQAQVAYPVERCGAGVDPAMALSSEVLFVIMTADKDHQILSGQSLAEGIVLMDKPINRRFDEGFTLGIMPRA